MARSKTEQKRLIKSHQAGDPAAFPQIFKEHYDSLLAHARRRLGNTPAAEDAVQETFLRAFRAVLRFNGRYRVGAWLHRILENVCADEGNRRRGEADTLARWVADPSSRGQGTEDESDQVLARRGVVEALEGLPDQFREALILRYLAGLSYREVAEATGVSEENARARVHRARKAINKMLGGASALTAAFLGFFRRTDRAIAHPGKAVESAGTQVTHQAAQIAAQIQIATPLEGVAAAKSTFVANLVSVVAAVAVPVSSIPALAPAAVSAAPEDPPPAVAVLISESSSFTDSLDASEGATDAGDSSQGSASISGNEQTAPTGSEGAKQKSAGAGSSDATPTRDPETTGEVVAEPASPSYEEVCGGAPSTEQPTIHWEGSRVTMSGTGLLTIDEETLEGWTQVQIDRSRQDEADPESQFDASYCHLREDGTRLTAEFTEGRLVSEVRTAADGTEATEYLFEGRYHYYEESANLNQWGRFSATFMVPDSGTPTLHLDFGPELQLGSIE